MGGRHPWALCWVQLFQNNVPRQAESEEGPAQAGRFQRIEQHLYQPKVQALATKITTFEVESDPGGSTIVNSDVENFSHHPKRNSVSGGYYGGKRSGILALQLFEHQYTFFSYRLHHALEGAKVRIVVLPSREYLHVAVTDPSPI